MCTDSGLIEGTAGTDPAVTIFKGIPYAAPPIGDLRWKAPQPVVPWTDVRKANTFGNNAMQLTPAPHEWWTEEFTPRPELAVDEDCLTLNIWTDKTSTNGKRPVLIFIHGGGNRVGAGSCPAYDGEALARKGVVVVTINYRLGIFGFLAHPALTAESPHHASGNYGLLDTIAALQWVKRNIAAFGGDPGNVTVQGQSAGSAAVHALTISPLAKGLIHRAITQSFNLITPGDTPDLAMEEAQGSAAFSGKTLDEMRAMSAADLMAMSWSPRRVIDGYALTSDLLTALKAGTQNDVPMISGTVIGDGSFFADGAMVTTVAGYESWANTTYGTQAAAFLAAYPAVQTMPPPRPNTGPAGSTIKMRCSTSSRAHGLCTVNPRPSSTISIIRCRPRPTRRSARARFTRPTLRTPSAISTSRPIRRSCARGRKWTTTSGRRCRPIGRSSPPPVIPTGAAYPPGTPMLERFSCKSWATPCSHSPPWEAHRPPSGRPTTVRAIDWACSVRCFRRRRRGCAAA